MPLKFFSLLVALCVALLPLMAAAQSASAPDHAAYAPTPPMGWNSFDIFVLTVTEAQVKEQTDVMAEELASLGWEYVVVDHQWYNPTTENTDYPSGARFTMDEYGRFLPAPNRFPSGMKQLADYVHGKGLKFGLHLMRGIPRQAYDENTPILGTPYHARDIADTTSTCAWNADMYGVDMSQPGAQAYYDSVFRQFAEWGLDFVKVDDLSRPYYDAEIEAIRTAIDRSGRGMVLSTSPGATPLEQGEHVQQHANMWRISDDFWDRWPPLYDMFERLHNWTPYRAEGAWPDADMLPFGILEFDRSTRFTPDEQQLCMTLWSIARSPLIFGGDLTRLDSLTTALLTNPEVLAVNQQSTNNRQLSREDDLIVWTADVPDSPDRYVALFNAQSNDSPFDLSQPTYRSPVLEGTPKEQVVEMEVPLDGARRLVLVVDEAGNGPFYDHAVWIEPTVTGPEGSLKLTDLDWLLATSGYHEVRKNRTVDDRPITLDGDTLGGIGAHAHSIVEFELPAGYDTFTARGMISEGSQGQGRFQFHVFVDPEKHVKPAQSAVSVELEELGFSGPARVRDLWQREDLGTFSGTFSRMLPLHGAGLYRLSPVDP